MEARNFSSWMRQVRDEPASDRIRYPGENDGYRARGVQCRRYRRICRGKDHIGRKSYNFLRRAAHSFLTVTSEPVVEADVAPVRPAEVLQGSSEGREIGLP